MTERQSIEAQTVVKAAGEFSKANQNLPDILAFMELCWDFIRERVGEQQGSGVTDAAQAPSLQPQAPAPTNGPVWGCPTCGTSPMKQRKAKDGSEFFGCSRYPECRGTRRLDGSSSLPKVKS